MDKYTILIPIFILICACIFHFFLSTLQLKRIVELQKAYTELEKANTELVLENDRLKRELMKIGE